MSTGIESGTFGKSTTAMFGDVVETALQTFVPGVGSVVAGVIDSLTESEKKDPKVVEAKVVKALNGSQILEQTKSYLKDNEGARNMQQSALSKAGKFASFIHSTAPALLAYSGLGALLYALYMVFFTTAIQPDQQLLIGGVIGTLGTLTTMAFSFFFGSQDKETK